MRVYVYKHTTLQREIDKILTIIINLLLNVFLCMFVCIFLYFQLLLLNLIFSFRTKRDSFYLEKNKWGASRLKTATITTKTDDDKYF